MAGRMAVRLAFLCVWSVSRCWFRAFRSKPEGLCDGWVQLRWSWLVEADLMRAGWDIT